MMVLTCRQVQIWEVIDDSLRNLNGTAKGERSQFIRSAVHERRCGRDQSSGTTIYSLKLLEP